MSQQNQNLQQIEQHRARIDELDRQIVAFLNERSGQSLAIRALKPGAGMVLFDPAREDQIFQKIEKLNEGPLTNDGLREIYAVLLKVMKETPAL